MNDADGKFVNSAQFNETEGNDDFNYSSLFEDDEVVDFSSISDDDDISSNSSGVDTGHVTDIYMNQKLKVIVVPVQLEKKTVEIFVTQDNVFCKNYLIELLGVLPEYVHYTTNESPWILPRVYPIRNGVIFNQLCENAQRNALAGLGTSIYADELSIYDIRQRCRNTKYELNYINSHLTLISLDADAEFGGIAE